MSGYYNRALRSNDRRYALVLEKLGYSRRDMVAQPKAKETAPAPATEPALSDLTALRSEYHRVVGKRPYHGWSAERLEKKIDEAKMANHDTGSED